MKILVIVSLLIGIIYTAPLSVELPKFEPRAKLSHDEVLTKIRSSIQSDPFAQSWLASKRYSTKPIEPCPEFNQSAVGQPWNNLRLPTNVKPISYEMEFYVPFFTLDAYSGVSVITLELNQSTDTIILHSKLLVILGIALIDSSDQNITVKCAGYYVPNDYFIVKTDSALDPTKGPFKLIIEFGGFLFLFESGLAKLSYEDGIKNKFVTSHFEPVDARKAFPCFDEPEFKAPFTITIDHPNDTIALSNMPALPDEQFGNSSDSIRTRFETTMPLPPYLIAITILPIDDFKNISVSRDNITLPISLWARNRYVDDGFAQDTLEMVADLFEAMLELFSDRVTKYPNKIDLVALPEYLDDAVPHLGLPLFKENKILFKESSVSQSSKQRIALLIAKQLSEIWFGGFISIKWWDELWLQEGLADFFKYKVVGAAYPTWRIRPQFVTEELIHVLVSDSYESSHPVIKNITSSFDIDQLFDDVETSKVGAILRMAEYEIEIDLVEYIFQLEESGIASADVLFNEIGKVEIWDSKDFFDRWFRQPNFPLVSVRLERRNNTNYLRVSQDRNLNSASSNFGLDNLYPSPYNWTWYLPLKCLFGVTVDDVDPQFLRFNVQEKEALIEIQLQDRNFTWVHCDTDFAGYYEMDYSPENWELLGAVLKTNNQFKPLDRANIIHNLFVNAFTERERYTDLVDVLSYLRSERDYIVWKTVQKHVYDMISIFEYRSTFYPVARFFNIELREIEQEIDLWSEADSHVDGLLKETILEMACRLQDVTYLKEASNKWKLVEAYLDDESKGLDLPVHTRSVVYNYHFQNTYDIRNWDYVFLKYKTLSDVQEQHRFLEALTYTRLPWLLAKFIENVGKFKYIDFFDSFALLAKQPLGRELAWNFYRENYPRILLEYSLEDPDVGQLLLDIVKTFDNEFLFEELKEFLDATPVGAQQNLRYKALETVLTTIVWLEDKEQEIQSAFSGPRLR